MRDGADSRRVITEPDPGAGSIDDLVVTLLDTSGAIIATTLPGLDGSYAFTGLAAGDYRIGFLTSLMPTIPDAGTDDTTDSDIDPATRTSGVVTLEPGETETSIDAGFLPGT